MIKNVVFDFDGTIADSSKINFKILDQLSSKYKFPKVGKKEIEYFKDKGVLQALKEIGLPIIKVPFLINDIKRLQSENFSQVKLFKGMKLTLRKLKRDGVKLGILTTNNRSNVFNLLDSENLNVFDFYYFESSLLGKSKMLQKMLRGQKIEREETVYVGDEDRDVIAAKKANIKVAAVTWGYNSKRLLASFDPDYLFNSPKELLSLI